MPRHQPALPCLLASCVWFTSFVVAFAVSSDVATAADVASKPNIVFILADDMGQGDLGVYNHDSKIPTPNMDRLAAEGMRFHDAHTPSSVCTPTRYGVLTGRYCWRSELKKGVLNGYSPALIEPGRLTVPAMLRARGYHTGCVGKWHLGLGNEQKTDYSRPLVPGGRAAGFDYFHVIPASLDMPPYLWVENDGVVEAPTVDDPGSERRWSGGGGFWRAGLRAPSFRHLDVLPTVAEKSVAYLEARAADTTKQPFFLYVPFNAPHTPWMPTDAFRGRSKAGYYGDFTVQVDDAVGRIVAALDRLGMTDDTLVIVTSDNGSHWRPEDIKEFGHEAHNGRRGMKADIHEAGHRVPFLARWPGRVPANTESHETICLTDLMATAAAIVGYDLPEDAGEDSYNLLPALLGQSTLKPIREATVHHSLDGMFAIRQDSWKLVMGLGSGGFTSPKRMEAAPGGPAGQLYDLASDPKETRNLWAEHPEVVERLTALLDKYRRAGRSR